MDYNGVFQVEQHGEQLLFRMKQGALSLETLLSRDMARAIAWAILTKTDEPLRQVGPNTFTNQDQTGA